MDLPEPIPHHTVLAVLFGNGNTSPPRSGDQYGSTEPALHSYAPATCMCVFGIIGEELKVV
jgi:hypothetical protein